MSTALDGLVDGVRRGDPRALARAISLVENETPEGRQLVGRLHRDAAPAVVIGITGPPGAGKSTLVDQLVTAARRRGQTVGVLAIDPTSPFTGGAILGDRVRMGAHAGDPGVFIRSMATRGQLGGLARAAADATALLAAAGKAMVIIETVGVGQDEVDVAQAADVVVVVLVPGTGDDVQAIKAGIMEIADVFVVNKADRDGADRMVHAIEMNLSLQSVGEGAWHPPVLKTVSTTGEGIPEVWAAIDAFRAHQGATLDERRRRGHGARLRELLAGEFMRHVEQRLPAGELDRIAARIAAREVDVYSAAAQLFREALTEPPGTGDAAPRETAVRRNER